MTVWLIIAIIIFLLFTLTVFFGAPYVPSQKKYVERAFDNAVFLTDKDVVVDIGAGDGVVLRSVARHGARAVGFEINPILFVIARLLSWKDPLVDLRFANFWVSALPDDTTIVYAFSVKRDNARLAHKMQQEANRLHRPLILLSHGNPLDTIQPDKTFDAYFRYTFRPLQGK